MRVFRAKGLPLLFIILMILAGCSQTVGSSDQHDDEVITLRVGAGVSTEHIINLSYLSRWMDEVEKQTNNKVEFETHYAGSLVAMGREYEALANGLVDIVLPLFQVYDPVRFPLSEVTMLPLLDSDVKVATAAYEELVTGDIIIQDGQTFYDLELGHRGLKMWPTPTTEAYNISFANSTGPETVGDIVGTTFRSSGRVAEIFSEKIGINAISLPASDLYDALSRGSIDGVYFSIPDWPSYGIDELFSYTIAGANLGHFSHTFGMTDNTWNSLPEDVQEVMERVAKEELASDMTYQFYDEKEVQSLQTNKDRGGIVESIGEQPEEIQEAITKAMVETWEEWILLNEDNGLPGKKVALLWRDLIIKHGGDVPVDIHELE